MANNGASIFSDVVCELGEGPSYDPASGKLFWFDIVGKKLLEKKFADGPTIVHDLPFMASAIATIDADRQLIAAEDGIYIRDVRTGALTLHTPLEADNQLTRANDSRVHPCGAFWIGTMARDDGPEGRRHLLVLQGRTAHALHRNLDPQFDLLFAGWRHRLFHRPDLQRHPARRLRPGDRPAARRTEDLRRHEPQRRLGRRLGGRCRRRDVECTLGRRRASTPGRRTAS